MTGSRLPAWGLPEGLELFLYQSQIKDLISNLFGDKFSFFWTFLKILLDSHHVFVWLV